MSTPVTYLGVTYNIPSFGDGGYAQGAGNLSLYLIALSNGSLTTSGGIFTLTGDANFGTSFGLIAPYYKSASANIATSGVLRLANTDTVQWRNFANSGNDILAVNGSDQLTYNGTPIVTGASSVSSITGTANEIIASSSTGAVTLSTPQPIAPSSTPTFAGIISNMANPASSGFLQLANTDAIAWRNAANTGNDGLVINGADQLQYSTAGGLQFAVGADTCSFNSLNSTYIIHLSILSADIMRLAVDTSQSYIDYGGSSGNLVFRNTGSGITRMTLAPTGLLTMTNSIAMASNKITGLATGTAPTDAANVGQTVSNPLVTNLAAGGNKITGLAQGTASGDSIAFPVGTAQLAAGAVSQFVAGGTTGVGDQTTVDESLTITTTGGAVLVFAALSIQIATGGSPTTMTLAATRSGTAIKGNAALVSVAAGVTAIVNASVMTVDNPAAGTYTYRASHGYSAVPAELIQARSFFVVELKK